MDEEGVTQTIQKQLIRCDGQEQELLTHFQNIAKDAPIQIDYPQNLRVSSDKMNQSIYTFRKAMRKN